MTSEIPLWISVWFASCAVGDWVIALESGDLVVLRPDGGRCPTHFVFDGNTASDVKRWLRTRETPRATITINQPSKECAK